MDLETIRGRAEELRTQVGRVVKGQDEVLDLLLIALLAEGHVLLEGVPGVAKTLLARCFAASLALDYGRIQFTPDLMPGDVLGTSLFNFQTNEFKLQRGPIFTELLLADEINRTPPKTQAALLEAMQERGITIDGERFDLGNAFIVVATQNPIEQEGTYPLPEAQLDRFLFKVEVAYPERSDEIELLRAHGRGSVLTKLDDYELQPLIERDFLIEARRCVASVHLADELIDYIVDVIRATRENASLLNGASPRAAVMLASAVRAAAALDGRDFVIPDDVKRLAIPALGHRVVVAPGAEIEGQHGLKVIEQILEQVPAPR